jgi:3-oxoacyl-[acyl-carrier protein] reductase
MARSLFDLTGRPALVSGSSTGIGAAVATEMTETIYPNEKFAANMMNRIPLKRRGEPGEVAGAGVFLACDAASCITGQVLPVDGGTVM